MTEPNSLIYKVLLQDRKRRASDPLVAQALHLGVHVSGVTPKYETPTAWLDRAELKGFIQRLSVIYETQFGEQVAPQVNSS